MAPQNKIKTIALLLPSFKRGDAIGNETVLMQETLRSLGYEASVYAEQWEGDVAAAPLGDVLKSDFGSTAILYHFSVGSLIPYKIAALPMLKMVRYHNITPPKFFRMRSEAQAQQACRMGRDQIPLVSVIADSIFAVSEYNASEMAPYAFTPPTVIPILRDYDTLTRQQDDENFARFFATNKKATLLFVGRIAPNKCQHDLIELFYLFHQLAERKSRLVLVGSFFSGDYRKTVEGYASALGLTLGYGFASGPADPDILVLNHVSEKELATLYRQADLFLCASDHEGFCVPIVEAMHFGLPVMAHRSSAVTETVGDGGVLFDKNDKRDFLAQATRLLTDQAARDKVIGAANGRKAFFQWQRCRDEFVRYVNGVMDRREKVESNHKKTREAP